MFRVPDACDIQECESERNLDQHGRQDARVAMAGDELKNPKGCEYQTGNNKTHDQS